MQFAEFLKSLESDALPAGIPIYVKALWLDAKGDWDNAHGAIDSLSDKNSCWVHAYLHRKEGDIWNADYWYSKAGKKRPAASLEEEWESITRALL